MNNPQYETERTIRIRDLFITVCQRWRSLIICFLIGAIVLGSYGTWKNWNKSNYSHEAIERLVANLDPERKGIIESYAETIKSTNNIISQQDIFALESAILKYNPYHLYAHELRYQIEYYDDTENEESSKLKRSALARAYVSKLQSIFFDSRESGYYEHTIKSNDETQKEVGQIVTQGDSVLVKINTKDIEDGFLVIQLLYQEPDNEEGVSELKRVMQEAEGAIRDEQHMHNLRLIGESNYQLFDSDILRIQQEYYQRIVDLQKIINTIEQSVTDSSEKSYLNFLISLSNEEGEASDQNVTPKTRLHISKKYILVGALLGLLLAAIVIIIKYIASNSIKTSKELEEDFGIQILGSFQGNTSFYQKRKTKLDQWLRKLKNNNRYGLNEEVVSKLIATKIKIAAEKNDLHNLCVAVDGNVTGEIDYLDAVAEYLGSDPTVKIIRNYLETSDELEGLSGTDAIVLVEQVEQSTHGDLRNTCALCRDYQINILGCIVVE